ncbi:MAG TPA: GNAT family N-acetyltransferase [Actinocrinis sp.]|jgi:GNAT superfamily N-acetyltransferase
MHLKRDDGYEFSDDKTRLDLDAVSEWLSTDAYWALGRPRRKTEAAIAASEAYGVYAPDGSQAAFARMVTDHETFAWLCDVYVARPHRGAGLGKWMVAALRDEYQAMGLKRILLATNDAHGVYATAGFTPLAAPERWMELNF